ncbi:MAG: Lrp/AsnC family transcriptional regulator [Haloplanus sp.]
MTSALLPSDVDEVDAHILNALLADARTSFRSIGDRVGVTATTVSTRVGALERRGIIRGYAPRLDYDRLGFGSLAVFQLRLENHANARVVDRVCEYLTMMTVFEVTGAYDVLAVGRFPGVDAVTVCARELAALDGVVRATPLLALDAPLSHRQFPLPPDGLPDGDLPDGP